MGVRNTALIGLTLLLAIVALIGGEAIGVRADFRNTLITSTAVLPSGTMTTTVTNSGVTIDESDDLLDKGCLLSGLGTATVTYTCDRSGSGIPAGTPIRQRFTTTSAQITETVTYNANGPRHVVPMQTISKDTNGTCTAVPNSSGAWACSVTTEATTVSGNVLNVTISPNTGQMISVTAAPSVLGTCPAEFSSLSIPDSPTDNPDHLNYDCDAGQTVPAGTSVNVAVKSTGSTTAPKIDGWANNEIGARPLPDLPVPKTDTLTLPAQTAPTSTSTSGSSSSSSGTTSGVLASYAAGWNMVAGPAGTVISGATGPLYTFQASDTNYEVISAGSGLVAGQGYWAYFDSGGGQALTGAAARALSIPLPAGRWIMVGNSGSTIANLSGADVFYSYSASAGYQSVSTLGPGAGAWALSVNGGTGTIQNR